MIRGGVDGAGACGCTSPAAVTTELVSDGSVAAPPPNAATARIASSAAAPTDRMLVDIKVMLPFAVGPTPRRRRGRRGPNLHHGPWWCTIQVVSSGRRDQASGYCVHLQFRKRKLGFVTEQEISITPNASRLEKSELLVYRRALQGEVLQVDEPGLASLVERGILLANTHNQGTYVPAPSGYLQRQLTAAVLQALTAATETLADIPAHVRELEVEQQAFNHSPSPVGTMRLESVPEVNAETIRAVQGAEFEVLTSQPGSRPPKVLKGALPRDLEAAQRGVTVRTIYRTSGRHSPTQRDWVATMTRAGAQVRTLGEEFMRLIIVDRKHAFFEVFEDGTVQTGMAWYTQDRGVCEAFAAHFRQQWVRADPWVPGEDEGGASSEKGTLTTKLQRTILRGIVDGKSYDAIADALGFSARHVTAQVSALRDKLGLKTVAQLTHWWATSPERVES